MNNTTATEQQPSIPTIAERWEDFAGKCISPNAKERDIAILKRAFYAGAIALYRVIIVDVGNLGDDKGPDALETLETEMRTFARDCVNEPLH